MTFKLSTGYQGRKAQRAVRLADALANASLRDDLRLGALLFVGAVAFLVGLFS